MVARLRGKVCKESMQCVQTWAPRTRRLKVGRARQKVVSVRLRAAITCTAHFSYFPSTIPKKYASPEATATQPHLLLHTLHTFHTFFYIEKDIRKEGQVGAREVDAVHAAPLHPVSSEESTQSMQSALARL